MFINGQTLVHKETNKLVRLDPGPDDWDWNINKKTAFISEDGTKFADNISNYTHVRDELGRPYNHLPGKGQFVDESVKKYLVDDKQLSKMRQKKLKEWEAEILDRMSGNIKTFTYFDDGKPKTHSSDSARKTVHCPFADGSFSSIFRDFFLRRRKAVPLYKTWNGIFKKYINGPMVFKHTDGKLWIYDPHMNNLAAIKSKMIIP